MAKAEQVFTDIMASSNRVITKTVRGLDYTFKYPSLVEQARIGVMRAKMLDGATEKSMDTYTDNLCYMLSTLYVVLAKTPKGFNLDTLYDLELLEEVYNAYIEWANSFRSQFTADSNEGSSSSTSHEETVADNEAV